MSFPIPLPHRVTVEAATYSKDANKGNVKTPAVIATDVECLITQGSGSLRTAFDQQGLYGRYTVTGVHESLSRDDTRYTVTTGPRVGKVFRVLGVSAHGPVEGILDTAFYRSSCEEVVT